MVPDAHDKRPVGSPKSPVEAGERPVGVKLIRVVDTIGGFMINEKAGRSSDPRTACKTSFANPAFPVAKVTMDVKKSAPAAFIADSDRRCVTVKLPWQPLRE